MDRFVPFAEALKLYGESEYKKKSLSTLIVFDRRNWIFILSFSNWTPMVPLIFTPTLIIHPMTRGGKTFELIKN